jgi:hypothetical protein
MLISNFEARGDLDETYLVPSDDSLTLRWPRWHKRSPVFRINIFFVGHHLLHRRREEPHQKPQRIIIVDVSQHARLRP